MNSMLGLVLLIASMFALDTPAQNMFTPAKVQYGPAPAFLPSGAQLAVLEGDPTASTGDFTVRLKTPNGYRIPPHWHPNRENATVILGNFKVGMGDAFDESKMMTYGAGSFGYMDPSMHHCVMASGEVIVQVHGMSPLQINYVNLCQLCIPQIPSATNALEISDMQEGTWSLGLEGDREVTM